MGTIVGNGAVTYEDFDSLIYEFFRETGGSNEMSVDGSITPVAFEWENERTTPAVLNRTLWDILDAAPTATKFGGIAGGLANGLLVELVDPAGAVRFDFLDGSTVKQNHHFGTLAGVDWLLTAGQGLDAVTVRWSLFRSGKELRLPPGFKLRVTVQDDLTLVDSMTIMLQGYYI